jgi:hypothetical protein
MARGGGRYFILDFMAKLAGLTLRHRWAHWDRSPFHRRQVRIAWRQRVRPGGSMMDGRRGGGLAGLAGGRFA